MGAGRTEFAMSIFGRAWGRKSAGGSGCDGQEIDVSNIRQARSMQALPM